MVVVFLWYTLSQLIYVWKTETVEELLKSDSICQSYAQMKNGPANTLVNDLMMMMMIIIVVIRNI